MLTTWFKRIGIFAAYISSGLIMLVAAMVVFSVIMRHVFHNPQPWVEEITAYLFVGFLFLALGYATLEGSHVSSDLFIAKASLRVQQVVGKIGNILALILCIVIVIAGTDMVYLYYSLGWKSSTPLGVTLWPVVAMIPLGFLIFALGVIVKLRSR